MTRARGGAAVAQSLQPPPGGICVSEERGPQGPSWRAGSVPSPAPRAGIPSDLLGPPPREGDGIAIRGGGE